MAYVELDNERERHCRMVFVENNGGVDDKKALVHAKIWDVYVNKKEHLIKGGYLVGDVSYDGNKVFWVVVDTNRRRD